MDYNIFIIYYYCIKHQHKQKDHINDKKLRVIMNQWVLMLDIARAITLVT